MTGDVASKNIPVGRFGSESPIYAFTTENINGYFETLELAGKTVLTVGGSGDHIINAYFFGAESVTAFDINPLALHWAQFKLVCLKHLSFGGFKKFLMRGGANALSHTVFCSLRKHLAAETAASLQQLYERFDRDGRSLRESAVFNNRFDHRDSKIFNNPYLRAESKYETARTRCHKNGCFMPSSLAELPCKLSGVRFDVVLLSNIADYARELFPHEKDYLRAFVEQLVTPLKPLLSKRGLICAAYVYDTDAARPEAEARSEIDIIQKRRNVFDKCGLSYDEISFPSVISGKSDTIVVLRQ